MKSKVFLLASLLVLAGCSLTPEKAPGCSGSLLRSCDPVVYFDRQSVRLTWDSVADLDWAAAKLRRWPSKYIKLVGHTAFGGRPDKNLILSKARALVVKKYLAQAGVNPDHIIVEFKGEMEPVCHKASCQNLNRRVEGKIYSSHGGWFGDNE